MKTLLLIPLGSLLAVLGCSRHRESSTLPQQPALRVQLTMVRLEKFPATTEVTGTIRPAQRAQLAAKVMGAIEEIPVALGQRVNPGEVLVKIGAAEIAARVTQAQSQLNAARRDLERERDLLTRNASTVDMVRGLEDRFAAAEAMVREANTMLGYTTVRAPFNGVVARKFAHAGDLASPGFPLLEVEGTTDYQVEAGIPDSLATRLGPGAELAIEVPAAGATFVGKLAELSPAADPNALTILAKIAVPAGIAVHSGQFARVRVPGEPATALMAPASAVSEIGQLQRVFVAAPTTQGSGTTRAVLRLVKTGASHGDRIEILSGIDENERVVVAPPLDLREGQPLEGQL